MTTKWANRLWERQANEATSGTDRPLFVWTSAREIRDLGPEQRTPGARPEALTELDEMGVRWVRSAATLEPHGRR